MGLGQTLFRLEKRVRTLERKVCCSTVVSGSSGFKEIIFFDGETSVDIDWDTTRKAEFGDFVNIEMWTLDTNTGNYISSIPANSINGTFSTGDTISVYTANQKGFITLN